MKAARRKGREAVVQILYQLDLNRDLSVNAGIEKLERHFSTDGSATPFTRQQVEGVIAKLAEIDAKLKEVSENWTLERMPVVDRNILRLGVFELLYRDDIPKTVTINEMVELARTFGAETSTAFVNGVLDKIAQTIDNPKKAP